jgi:hypothetical protein
MKGASDITKLKFEYNNENIVPISTWLSELNIIYIKFQKTDNTTVNIACNDLIKYIKSND